MRAPAAAARPATSPTTRAERFRVAAELGIGGPLRFLSHHDQLRMLARALVRAGWPLAYSQGYNPQPRIVLPLPRPVGTASDCDWALVGLYQPRPAAELSAALARALPAGCRLSRLLAPAPPGAWQPRRVSYQVELAPADARQVAGRIGRLLALGRVTVARQRGPRKPTSSIDIRPLIDDIVCDGRCLRLRVRHERQRCVRPAEILIALGLAPAEYADRIRRTEVEWHKEPAGPSLRPAASERKHLDKQEEFEPTPARRQEDPQPRQR